MINKIQNIRRVMMILSPDPGGGVRRVCVWGQAGGDRTIQYCNSWCRHSRITIRGTRQQHYQHPQALHRQPGLAQQEE